MSSVAKRNSYAHFQGGIEPSSFIYEDEQCVVFDEEVNKQAPVHFLVVPRKVIPRLTDASLDDEKLLGHLLIVARRVAKMKEIAETGFRVVMNEGANSCNSVGEFHVIVFGHMLIVAKKVIIDMGLDRTGYHVMVDEDHRTKKFKSIHVFGRALHHMVWPIGPGSRL